MKKKNQNQNQNQSNKYKDKIRVCLVLNIAPLYRKSIFNTLDANDDVNYFFAAGDFSYEIDALYDIKRLSGYKSTLYNCYNSNHKLVWQKNVFKLLFARYDAFILTGNPGIRSNWIFMVLAKLMGKNVYLWTHGLYGNESKFTLFKNKLYMKLASGLFLYGNYAKQLLLKEGFKDSKMSVVYNSLSYEVQKLERGKYKNAGFMRNYFGNDFPVILFVGRLTPQKQLDLLIDAVGILKISECDVNIMFLGAGECEQMLKKRTEDAGIDDRVWFYGECYDEQMIATAFQNSHLCVSPGNVGLTAIHSLSYGVPVITHNYFKVQMPEFEAIKRGVNGDFFRYKDVVELSDVIQKWIRITTDVEKQKTIQELCYKVVDDTYNPIVQNEIITKKIIDDLS